MGSLSISAFCQILQFTPKEHCKFAYGLDNSWGRDTAFSLPNGRKQQIGFFSKVIFTYLFIFGLREGVVYRRQGQTIPVMTVI